MKVSGVADRRRAVVRLMGLLFTLNNVLQRRQMRRLAARDHIRQISDLKQRPGTKDRLGLFHARAGDVCTTFGR